MSENHGRYMVFIIEAYYPSGGLGDVDFSSNDKDEAVAFAENSESRRVYVWDRIDDEIVFERH